MDRGMGNGFVQNDAVIILQNMGKQISQSVQNVTKLYETNKFDGFLH